MNAMPVAEAARICQGTLTGTGGDAPVGRVTIDSRTVGIGDLFVALPGSRVDGNAFVVDALRRGAAAVVAGPDAPPLPEEFADRALIRVKYPRKSLADLAAAHRRTLKCPVIAITGTNGKSSTREMIAAVLAPLGEVVQSERSYNNDLGVPLTILRAGPATAALVVEIGTSARGEIRHLAGITRPDVAVVTNVGPGHLEGLGSEDGVAMEKGCLVECVGPEGAVVLNADDPRVMAMASRAEVDRVVTFSTRRTTATVWGHGPARTETGVECWLYGKLRLELPVAGLHNVENAMAAAAVGLLHGISAPEIAQGLLRAKLPALRMERRECRGATLLVDCYNANPASLAVAVDELSGRAGSARRVAVVGDMLELGRRTEEYHREAGRMLAERVDVLWCVGRESRAVADGALAAGMHPEQVFWSPTTEQALLDRHVTPSVGDMVLVKGSRAMRLEDLAASLAADVCPAGEPPAPRVLPKRRTRTRKVG